MKTNLTIKEIDTLRHALAMHRQTAKEMARLAREETSDKAARDFDRYQKIISESLALDTKLSDIADEIA